jgi:hypothetical protein
MTLNLNFFSDDDDSTLGDFHRSEESKLGFNMCECGFEGIAIKVAKRSSNQEECPQESALNLLDKSDQGSGSNPTGEHSSATEDTVEIENEIPQPAAPKRGEEIPFAHNKEV